MKVKQSKLNILTTFFLSFGILIVSAQVSEQDYIYLKTYTFETEAQSQLTDEYLEGAYLQALKRQNIKNIGVFKNYLNEKDSTLKTYVLFSISDLTSISKLDRTLLQDVKHQEMGKTYLQASHEEPAFKRVETTIMQAFSEMPKLRPTMIKGPRSKRIYELRSYESSSELKYFNKVDMFNAGGEVALFEKLGFNAVFYAEVIAGADMPNLMYMTTHKNKKRRTANWKSFSDAPEWNDLKSQEKYQNNVSRNETLFLYPTSYSDY